MLMKCAAAENHALEGAGILNAYLFGKPDVINIMKQPTDPFGKHQHLDMVCRLVKSIWRNLAVIARINFGALWI